jgi:hypothetical protein
MANGIDIKGTSKNYFAGMFNSVLYYTTSYPNKELQLV